jgi:hypothetical protein
MKQAKWYIVCAVCVLCAVMISLIACDNSGRTSLTGPTEEPQTRGYQYNIGDGIRVNGTEQRDDDPPTRTYYFTSRAGDDVHNGPSPEGNYWTKADARLAKAAYDAGLDQQ